MCGVEMQRCRVLYEGMQTCKKTSVQDKWHRVADVQVFGCSIMSKAVAGTGADSSDAAFGEKIPRCRSAKAPIRYRASVERKRLSQICIIALL